MSISNVLTPFKVTSKKTEMKKRARKLLKSFLEEKKMVEPVKLLKKREPNSEIREVMASQHISELIQLNKKQEKVVDDAWQT